METTRIEELISIIIKANDDYYNKSAPTLSDKVYDAYKDELKDLAAKCKSKKLIKKAEQVLNSIGAPVVSEWKKVSHDFPMTSLNKVNTPDEFKSWCKDCAIAEVFMTEKLDGTSINTVWENGILVQAITRGSGDIGEEITPNVKKMKGIPKKLNKHFSGSLRGEIVLLNSDLKTYFPEYANARNAASGISKRYDGKGSEHLTVMIYQVIGKDFKTEIEQFKYIEELGLLFPWHNVFDIDTAINWYDKYQKEIRSSLDYDIDGLVGRVNNISDQLALGELNHRPKGAIAFKFEAEARETTLRNIVWQVGSTGRITPVAEFDTVELVGAKINRASLYNYSYIEELALDVGAKVLVERNNDVIPSVKEITQPTGTVAKPPNNCPVCNAQTHFVGEYLVCSNKLDCPAQTLGRLEMWINELNILDVGSKLLQKLLDEKLIEDVYDLYTLKTDQVAKLDRMGEKSAQNLIDTLNKHREIPLENFIGGLGIENVATSSAKLVIKAGYNTLDAILAMSLADFMRIDGFGFTKAQCFFDGLRKNRERIKKIQESGVKIVTRDKGKLSNFSFCFSGAMPSGISRPKLHQMVLDNGGDVEKSVKKGLTYLVLAEANSTSSKAQAARKLGTKCISEKEFMDLLND